MVCYHPCLCWNVKHQDYMMLDQQLTCGAGTVDHMWYWISGSHVVLELWLICGAGQMAHMWCWTCFNP